MKPAGRRVVVAGEGALLEACLATLCGHAHEVRSATLERLPGRGYDLSPLVGTPADEWLAFAAVGNDLLNLLRLSLMSSLRSAGFRLASVVSPAANVPDGWTPGDNVFVGDRAVIGAGSSIKHAVVVNSGAVVGVGVRLEHSVWIGEGAILGPGAVIGSGTIVAPGAVIGKNARIGRQCDLGLAREYLDDVPDKTYFGRSFDDPVRIFGPLSE